MQRYGKRIQVISYIPEETFLKLDAERGSQSISGYVSELLDAAFSVDINRGVV